MTPAVKHGPRCPPRSSARLTGPVIHGYVIDEAEAQGVQIIPGRATKHLITNEAGEVIGVTADQGGTAINVKAGKGVILNAGGMCNNPEMLAQYMRFGAMRIAAGTRRKRHGRRHQDGPGGRC